MTTDSHLAYLVSRNTMMGNMLENAFRINGGKQKRVDFLKYNLVFVWTNLVEFLVLNRYFSESYFADNCLSFFFWTVNSSVPVV